MYKSEGTLLWSATDVVQLSQCQYGALRRLDEVNGLRPKLDKVADAMMQRAGELGDTHESDQLARLREAVANTVGASEHDVTWIWRPGDHTALPEDIERRLVIIDLPEGRASSLSELVDAATVTLSSLKAGAAAVHQATVFVDGFRGHADFVVREDVAGMPAKNTTTAAAHYVVVDAKVARSVRSTALLQIGCYTATFADAGVALSDHVQVVLGTGETVTHDRREVEAVAREAMARFVATATARTGSTDPVQWGDDDVAICGSCDYCAESIAVHDDLLQVANLRREQRAKLRAAGITTMRELAVADQAPPGFPRETFASLNIQAKMQTRLFNLEPNGGTVIYTSQAGHQEQLDWALVDRAAIDALPDPNPGDVYFDFEGDPLWRSSATGEWGIDYLFGYITRPDHPGAEPPFTALWAHNLVEEKQALKDFIDFVAQRREQYPGMHVYHYAPYEKAHLLSIAARHGAYEDEVDNLLRQGVFVDLLPVVRKSLRISEGSYSIKKLEPLYMGANLRTGDVTDAATSITVYADYCEARDGGDHATAKQLLDGIADYNEYDCVSTLELDAWLRERARASSLEPATPMSVAVVREPAKEEAAEVPQIERAVSTRIAEVVDAHDLEHGRENRSADIQALAMIGAATGFASREGKTHWQNVLRFLELPLSDWPASRDFVAFTEVNVVEDWHDATKSKTGKRLTRIIEATFELPDGAVLGSHVSIYDEFADVHGWDPGLNMMRLGPGVSLVKDSVTRHGELTVAQFKETKSTLEGENVWGWPDLPLGLGPTAPPPAKPLEDSISAFGEQQLAAYEATGKIAPHPLTTLLCRNELVLPAVQGSSWASVVVEALEPEHACVAVQGPPGTGKTFTGSRVIAALLQRGWRIGVVGQSHSTVENLLEKLAEVDGIDAKKQLVKVGGPTSGGPWTKVSSIDDSYLPGGHAVGATAWPFAKLSEADLDLLVVDEAGQYSLAMTMAAGRAAKRLLLLGDPQQLPQVSQALHPEHVEESALSWVAEDGIVPASRGYLLDTTYRMRPEVTETVSRLSYRGLLHAAPPAALREVEGLVPGVHTVMVPHVGNSTASREEADEVVAQVRHVLGREWTDRSGDAERTGVVDQSDVLVVTPFNAQGALIRDRLEAAGYPEVEVGTVDKFQGREALVVVVSTASSSAADSPRGIGFVISRNRINVAISRAQVHAVIVRSPSLTAAVPNDPQTLEELGAFINVCSSSVLPALTPQPERTHP